MKPVRNLLLVGCCRTAADAFAQDEPDDPFRAWLMYLGDHSFQVGSTRSFHFDGQYRVNQFGRIGNFKISPRRSTGISPAFPTYRHVINDGDISKRHLARGGGEGERVQRVEDTGMASRGERNRTEDKELIARSREWYWTLSDDPEFFE